MLHSASGQARAGKMPGLARDKILSLSKTDTTLSDTDGSQQLLRMNRNLMRDNSRKDAIVEIYLC